MKNTFNELVRNDNYPKTYLQTIAIVMASAAIMLPGGVRAQDDNLGPQFSLEVIPAVFNASEDLSGQDRGSVTWGEAAIRAGLTGEAGSIYYGLSAVGTGTFGDGDPAGLTTGDEREVDLEDGYLGWKNETFDVSLGAQNFELGDGFLIWGDALNFGEGIDSSLDRGGAYWLGGAGRRAFRKTAVVRVNTSPVRGDLFYLGSDNDGQAETELAGINLEYNPNENTTLGLSYLNVLDVDEDNLLGLGFRDGLDTYSLRGSTAIDNLFLSAEYAIQSNDGEGAADIDADAWYVEGAYSFTDMAWSPTLTYRYSSFTGDDPNTTENEAFDPLFYGFSRGYGTWFQGEIAGNFTGPFNSNADIHHLGLKVSPKDNLGLGLLYFNYKNDHPTGASDDFGQEIDLYFEWGVKENLFVSGFVGYFDPDDEAIAQTGVEDETIFTGLFAVWNF